MFLIQSATTQQHVHTQVHLKELEYLGKVTFFTYSRFIKHTIKYFKLNIFCFNFDDPVSQNIRTEHKTNTKKRIIIYYIYILSFMYSILSRGSLCMNYCINAAKPVTSAEKEITISMHRLEMVISFFSRT